MSFEQKGGLCRGKPGDGTKHKDGAHWRRQALQPLPHPVAVRPGDHPLQFLAGNAGGVQFLVVNTGDGMLQALGRGQAGGVARGQRIQRSGNQCAAAVLAGLQWIVTTLDLGIGHGRLHQADAVLAFAHQHGSN